MSALRTTDKIKLAWHTRKARNLYVTYCLFMDVSLEAGTQHEETPALASLRKDLNHHISKINVLLGGVNGATF